MPDRPTLSLVEFLEARLDENEAGWLAKRGREQRGEEPIAQLFGRNLVEQALADIAAKRAILAEHAPNTEYDDPYCPLCQWDICCDAPKADYHRGAGTWPCDTVKLLAAPFADSPGFDPAWEVEAE